MINVYVWSLFIFHSRVMNKKCYSISSVWGCPVPANCTFSFLLPNSTMCFPYILSHFPFSSPICNCVQILYVNLTRLELLPTSIPWSPTSSTYLTFFLTLQERHSARVILSTQGHWVMNVWRHFWLSEQRAGVMGQTPWQRQRVNSAEIEKPGAKLSTLSCHPFSSTIPVFPFYKIFLNSFHFFPPQLLHVLVM